jgi:hypothetical protein
VHHEICSSQEKLNNQAKEKAKKDSKSTDEEFDQGLGP